MMRTRRVYHTMLSRAASGAGRGWNPAGPPKRRRGMSLKISFGAGQGGHNAHVKYVCDRSVGLIDHARAGLCVSVFYDCYKGPPWVRVC